MGTYSDLSLVGLVANRLPECGEQSVLIVENGGKTPDQQRTYRDLWRNGHRLAWVLSQQGLRRGDCFALLMANHAEFVDAMLAAAITGTIFVPIDPRTKGDKLAFFLGNAQCRGVIAADYALANLLEVRGAHSHVQWVLGLESGEGDDGLLDAPGVTRYERALAAQADKLEHPLVELSSDSPMQLIYTSGTTGDPKGIVMTHGRYCQTAQMARQMFAYRDDDRPYSGLSLTHANAQVVTLGAALANGLCCVLSRRFTKSRLWDITRRYGCTSFSLLGGMTTAVYAEQPRPDDSYNPVRFVISAGMPAAIWEDFERRFGLQVLEFYGAAEGGLTIKPIGVGPVGSIGKPIASLRQRIVDEQGHDCPPGTPGELWLRPADGSAYQVEYFNNPQASQKKCAEGWLHMGDVVVADDEGWLFFQYRMGSGIRCNGEFVNPAFIEKLLAEQPEVDDVHVYGIPAASGAPGEKDVVAAVVAKSDLELDPQALFRVCRERLESSYVPHLLQVLQQIPKTASEKPQERYLIEALERDPASVYRETR